MTCREAREYLFAFLDNELDAPLSIEVHRHLEHCAYCAREAEIERETGKRLAGYLRSEEEAPPFDERNLQTALTGAPAADSLRSHGRRIWSRIISRFQGRRGTAPSFHWGGEGASRQERFIAGPNTPSPFREVVSDPIRRRSGLRRSFILGAGLAAALVVSILLWHGRSRDLSTQGPHDLAHVVVADFEHFVGAGQPLHLASPDTDAVTTWLREATGLAVAMPDLEQNQGRLMGARKCYLAGKVAAFASYELGDDPACLIVAESKWFDVGSMQRVEDRGHTHYVDRCKGHTVVACQRGNLVYAAVSDAAPERVFSLMTGRSHEGD